MAVSQELRTWRERSIWIEIEQREWIHISNLSDASRVARQQAGIPFLQDSEGLLRWATRLQTLTTDSQSLLLTAERPAFRSGPEMPPTYGIRRPDYSFDGTQHEDHAGTLVPFKVGESDWSGRVALVASGSALASHMAASSCWPYAQFVCARDFLDDPARTVSVDSTNPTWLVCEAPSVRLRFWLSSDTFHLQRIWFFASGDQFFEVDRDSRQSTTVFEFDVPQWSRLRTLTVDSAQNVTRYDGTVFETLSVSRIAPPATGTFDWTTYQPLAADQVERRLLRRVAIERPGEFVVEDNTEDIAALERAKDEDTSSIRPDGALTYEAKRRLSWTLALGAAIVCTGGLLWWRKRVG